MSRTIRRKNESERTKRKFVTILYRHDNERVWMHRYEAFTREEQQELDKSYHRYHGDHWYSDSHLKKAYVEDCQVRLRMKAKNEIMKFMKNEDYEPIIPDVINDSWWYWSWS